MVGARASGRALLWIFVCAGSSCRFDPSGLRFTGDGGWRRADAPIGRFDGRAHDAGRPDHRAPDTFAPDMFIPPGPPDDIWVSAAVASSGDGTFAKPYKTIGEALCNGGALTPGASGYCTGDLECGMLGSGDGTQTIHLEKGMYKEDLTVFARCHLVGAGASSVSITPATGGHSAVYVPDGTGVLISGVTITGGMANDTGADLDDGGGIKWSGGGGTIEDVVFSNDQCNDHGSALAAFVNAGQVLTVFDCIFTGNTATGMPAGTDGGGTIATSSTGATIDLGNDLFYNNKAVKGSGVFLYAAGVSVQIEASTFSANTTTGGGGSTLQLGTAGDGSFTVDSTILWNDSPANAEVPSGQAVTYSDVQEAGSAIHPGTGNIDADPKLTSSYGLASTSPCIGNGNPAMEPTTDLAGASRTSHYDIGAYEGP